MDRSLSGSLWLSLALWSLALPTQQSVRCAGPELPLTGALLAPYSGRLLARVSSRPGQSGRCDGYLLEGKELDFYMRKLRERRGK